MMDGEHMRRSWWRWTYKMPLVMLCFVCMAIVGLAAGAVLFIWSVPYFEELMRP